MVDISQFYFDNTICLYYEVIDTPRSDKLVIKFLNLKVFKALQDYVFSIIIVRSTNSM